MNENPGCNRGLPWPGKKRKPAVVIESSSEAEEQETLGVQRGGKGDMPDSRRDGEKRRHTPDTSRNKKERRNDAWKSGLESWTSTDDRKPSKGEYDDGRQWQGHEVWKDEWKSGQVSSTATDDWHRWEGEQDCVQDARERGRQWGEGGGADPLHFCTLYRVDGS